MKSGLTDIIQINSLMLTGGTKMTDEERMQIMNANYEHDKAEITRDEMKFGNMNYYLKKEEYIKKHLWKTAKQFRSDIIEAMKKKIRG